MAYTAHYCSRTRQIMCIQILITCCLTYVFADLLNSCDSPVYCNGRLLDTVQFSSIFSDSKTFVDLKMKNNLSKTLENFEEFMSETNQIPSRQEVHNFVESNFEETNELQFWVPSDYNPTPKLLGEITDPVIKDFARSLVELWSVLGRKINPDIYANSDLYSIIPVPNGFIIPGGRFREFYYWDTYWIVKGLLICEMKDSVRGILENFIYVIKQYGFIPNGGRIYYLNRSQPPLLTAMAAAYFRSSNNIKWMKENIQYMEQELNYWLENKLVSVNKNGAMYDLAHYSANGLGPRPESYVEDISTASMFASEKENEKVYIELKSGAESGWDFSSRWIFDQQGGNEANLSYIQTRRVVPVDLNSFLCGAFTDLSHFYLVLGKFQKSMFWREKALYWTKAMEQVLWNEDDGIWYDYDVQLSTPRKYFYVSNVTPLWTGCFASHRYPRYGKRVLNYLKKTGALETLGGVPTSLENSGEQWDYSNAWAPLQAILVEGLEKTNDSEAQAVAEEIAKRWVSSNTLGFRNEGEMFEKYDAVVPGRYGGGGEYIVQSGFGWSNGVALEFIYKYYRNDTKSRYNFWR